MDIQVEKGRHVFHVRANRIEPQYLECILRFFNHPDN